MDLYYKQEIKVGLLVLVGLGVMFFGLMWLSGRSVRREGRVMVPVQFESVSGLTAGDPVHISGVSVGRVASVELQEVGRVLVRLEVQDRVRPHTDAQASIRALDFLGAKYVDYQPGSAPDFLPRDSLITGGGESELATSAARLTDLAADALKGTQAFLSEQMASQVRQTLAASERALGVVTRLGSGPMADELEQTVASLRRVASRLDTTLANPAIDKSVSQLDELTTSLNEMAEGLAATSNTLASILRKLESREGSFGRMLSDTTLAVELEATLQSMRKLLDDIREQPGRYGPRAIKLF